MHANADSVVAARSLITLADYCDIYLTHDSASVRKAHNEGWKHRLHVKNYFAGAYRNTPRLIDAARGPPDILSRSLSAPFPFLVGGIPDFFRANNIMFREDHEHWRRARDREREMRGEPPLSRRPEPVPVRFGAPPGGLPILTGANLPEDSKCT